MTETLFKTCMGALLVAAIPATDDLGPWAQWGLAGLVVGYTLWRDHQRERRMAEAIERYLTWVQTTLLSALERSVAATEKMTERFSTKRERE